MRSDAVPTTNNATAKLDQAGPGLPNLDLRKITAKAAAKKMAACKQSMTVTIGVIVLPPAATITPVSCERNGRHRIGWKIF